MNIRAVRYTESGDSELPPTARPVIYGLNHVVSTGHWLTTMAGARMLMSGGNAFDAVAAATLAAAVVEPTSSFSLGSECVYMLRDARSGDIRSLCGQGPASHNATPAFFRDRGLKNIPTGPGEHAPLAFTTPGMMGATLRLLLDYGTKSVQEIARPAIGYARDGISHYEYMISRLEPGARAQFDRYSPEGAAIFFPGGRRPQPGTLLRQPALARVLQALSDAGDGLGREDGIRAARALFYRGAVADRIAAASARLGGILDKRDLQAFEEEYEQPVSGTFRGRTIRCQSFWTQAPVVIQALNIIETFDLLALGFNSPAYVHTVSEALKLAFADREAYYADPRFARVPADALLSKEYARSRAKLIDPNRTSPEFQAGRMDGHRHDRPVQWETTAQPALGPESGTTHVSVIDAEGNVVAATPSGGAFVKSVYFDDLGFTLSTRSEMLSLHEGHPNCVAPGKRPRTTLVNYIVTGGPETMAVGCPGGDAQVQASLQLILNILVWGMNPQEAVEAPRFATLSVPNSFHPHSYFEGRLAMEKGFGPETAHRLREMGHEVTEVATCGMGATISVVNEQTGVRATSSDPRRSCHALGW